MHRRQSAAQPQNHSTKTNIIRRNGNKLNHCPNCNGYKYLQSKLCASCTAWSKRPPILDKDFIVDGDVCRKIPLTRGQYAIVDKGEYDRIIKHFWHALPAPKNKGNTYYAVRYASIKGKQLNVMMHREILGLPINGRAVQGDHKNHDGLDNRRNNLRKCNYRQNTANNLQRRGASGYRGVYAERNSGWAAVIRVNRQAIRLGTFRTKLEAAEARDRAAIKYQGEFAVLNFPHLRPPA